MIPKVIHFIFFGFTDFEYVHYLAVKSALKVHKHYQIKLHYTKHPENNPLWDEISKQVTLVYCEPPTHFNSVELTSFQYKADIKRLEILIQEGGIYMDIDVISLKSFDNLLNNSCVMGLESGDGDIYTAESVTNAVMLCEPNHPFMIDWLEKTGNNLENKPWAYHAVNLPLELLKTNRYNVHVEPKKSFMPFGWRDDWIFGTDVQNLNLLSESYTIHMWETIWYKNYLSKLNDEYIKSRCNLFTILCEEYCQRNIMPQSNDTGKNWIEHQLNRIKQRTEIKNVLDIGAGEGTYWNKYSQLFDANWTGVEVWSPYIERYDLNRKYNQLINQDARLIDYSTLTNPDIVFAGDVLEHMTKKEAIDLVDKLLSVSKCLFISIPIIYMPQGEWEGNPYEEHVKDDWTDSEVKETFGSYIINHECGEEIGVYLLSKDETFKKTYSKYKIAIYTICKNEERYVSKWANSNKEADIRLVCDTGSTDNTKQFLENEGVTVIPISVMPWRFDLARNTALNLLPADIDICIWQDLDEELLLGWREQLESNWKPGVTIANHRYRNNDKPWQWHSKIHARHNCYWTGAVHETLKWTVDELPIYIPELYLDEHQDTTKDRTGYLNLLEKKISEGDKNWRTYYFLANDYQTAGQLDKTIETRIKSYDACDEGNIIKSYIARNIAINYTYQQQNGKAERWFDIGINDSPEKETLFHYAEYLYNIKDWDRCYLAAKKCISINVKRDGFTYDPKAWEYLIYDYAALAAYNLKIYDKAVEYGSISLQLNPDDSRLKNNLSFYEEGIVIPIPEVIELETSANCNRTCNACLRNTQPDREKVDSWFSDNLMPMEKIKLIFDQARAMGYKKDLGLSHYNEPLMDPRIVDILKLAKNYPFKNIFFHSNGDFLTEELASQIDGLADWIVFSVYAASPAKEKREEQIRSWFKITQPRFTQGLLGLTHFGPTEHMDEIVQSVIDLPCREPQDRFIINHKGEMEFCCDDIGNNFGLGSVSEDNTLHDLWFNIEFQKNVKQLKRAGGRRSFSYCKTCPRPKEQTFVAKNIKVIKHEKT